MLISPPFLPARTPTETEAEWLDRAMPEDENGHGNYPISFGTSNADQIPIMWHTGQHIKAPDENGAILPVRAIADGTVVFVRQPEAPNSDVNHPLNYGDESSESPVWTSNGCVVIKHTTEIGAPRDESAPATVINFFSVYMHMQSISSRIIAGKPIYRKDEIGGAGYIYGQPNLIHFEILCDDANLQAIIGRPAGELSLANAADGRADAIFGEIYYWLSGEHDVFSINPLQHAHDLYKAQDAARKNALPIPLTLPQAQSLREKIKDTLLGIKYDGVGNAIISTYSESGALIQSRMENGYEYTFFQEASRISAQLADLRTDPNQTIPSASSIYELLRFGRVTGPDQLTPIETVHWRMITTSSGQEGWVNLNRIGIQKFSDADMPIWQHWRFISDFQDGNSRCDSPTIRRWLDADGDLVLTPNEVRERILYASLQLRMKKLVCRIPYEWDESTIENRWRWLKSADEEHIHSMNEIDFERFKNHVAALCFWRISMGIPKAPWFFYPKSFISHFRKSFWISDSSFRKIYPKASPVNVKRYRNFINKCCRKYCIETPLRLSHFLGQAAVESGQLTYTSELYNGDPFNYFRHYAKAKNFIGWLGNVEWNDGGKFRGRGFKQMTGRENYSRYWLYRGWLKPGSFNLYWWKNTAWWGLTGNSIPASQVSTPPIQDITTIATLIETMRPPIIDQPDIVSSDDFTCIDTAGWFWAKNGLLSIADKDNAAEMTRKIRGDGPNTGVTTPWPSDAHYTERETNTKRIFTIVGDAP